MVNEKMNRKGRIVLRDLVFMVILFAGVMALISIFVGNMAETYDSNMSEEYTSAGGSAFGTNLMSDVGKSTDVFKNATTGNVGAFQLATGIITGAGTILIEVVLMPIYIGSTIEGMLVMLTIDTTIASIIANIISFLIYGLIAFVILSALLKGGEA